MLRRASLLLTLLGLLLTAGSAGAAETAAFRLRDLNGKTVDLAALCAQGPVLISFWATYCEPCKKEIPHLVELVKEFQDQKLQLVLITVDSPRSQKQVKPYVTSKGWNMPVLMDPNGQTMKKLKGGNPPYTLLVGSKGEILYSHSGYKPGDEKVLKQEVDRLLKAAQTGAKH
ncbi:MAG: TlpA disulfide reductase family protein [Candidatus Delongbacteria bacterium]